MSCEIYGYDEYICIEGGTRRVQLLEWIQMGVWVDVDSRIAYGVEDRLETVIFELSVLLEEAKRDLFEADGTGTCFSTLG